MAERHPILELTGPPTKRVRYGRATLTIAQSGDLNRRQLGEAIASYESGDLSAEDVCWELVRDRVQKHSPSFGWDDADRKRVLELVTGVAVEPKFESADPEEVASELIRAAKEEMERLKEASGRLNKTMEPVWKLNNLFGSKSLGAMTRLAGLEQTNQMLKRSFPQFRDLGALGIKRPIFQNREWNNVFGKQFSDPAKLGLAGKTNIFGNDALADLRKKLVGPQFSDVAYVGKSNALVEIGKNLRLGADYFQGIRPKLSELIPPLKSTTLLADVQKQMDSIVKAFEGALPTNWRDLEQDEIEEAVKLMAEEGLSLAWAPRPEIIRALLAAPDHAERCRVLERYSQEIVEDVEAVLDDVNRGELEPVAEAVDEAIKTYRDGHPAPAQTYAATALGELLHGVLGHEDYRKVRLQFRGKDPMHDVGFRSLPLYAVGTAWVRCVDRFDDAGDGFNRNLTVHYIGYHSEANLLSALTLLVGLLMEFQRRLNVQDPPEEEELAA